MRLIIEFLPEPICIPIAYNELIQAVIYANLSEEYGQFLHDKGYELGKRTFKLFTYSNLLGQYKIIPKYLSKNISFQHGFKLIVSSPIEQFIRELATTLSRNKYIELYHQKAYIKNITLQGIPIIEQNSKIELLSPIIVYSTIKNNENKDYRYFFNPKEEKFNELITSNIKKKYEVFTNKKIDGEIKLNAINIDERKLMFKNTFAKGYMGVYEISGTQELINFAYECGLGSKNSQGAGLFSIIKG